ncbi:hypothetical protein M8J76_015792 [Diaphorina citri]|nr:hypothetical protein M8J76_015792 [Diaphorina citri]
MSNNFLLRKTLLDIVNNKIEPFIEKIFAQCNFESVQTSLLVDELVDVFSDQENFSTFKQILQILFKSHVALTYDEFKKENLSKKLINLLFDYKFQPTYNARDEEVEEIDINKQDEIIIETPHVPQLPNGCVIEQTLCANKIQRKTNDEILVNNANTLNNRINYKKELVSMIEELKCENQYLKLQNENLITGNPHAHCETMNQQLMEELKQLEMQLKTKRKEKQLTKKEVSQGVSTNTDKEEFTETEQTGFLLLDLLRANESEEKDVHLTDVEELDDSYYEEMDENKEIKVMKQLPEIDEEKRVPSLELKIQQINEEKVRLLEENERLKKEIEIRQKLRDTEIETRVDEDTSGKCEHVDHNSTGTFEDLEELLTSIQSLEEENQAKDSLIAEYKSQLYELQCYMKLTRQRTLDPLRLNSEGSTVENSRASMSFQEELIDLEQRKSTGPHDANKIDPDLSKIDSSLLKQKYDFVLLNNSNPSSHDKQGAEQTSRLNIFDYEHSTTSEEDCEISRISHWNCSQMNRIGFNLSGSEAAQSRDTATLESSLSNAPNRGTAKDRVTADHMQTMPHDNSNEETHYYSIDLINTTDPNMEGLPSPIRPFCSPLIEDVEENADLDQVQRVSMFGFIKNKRELIPRELKCTVLENSIPEETSGEKSGDRKLESLGNVTVVDNFTEENTSDRNREHEPKMRSKHEEMEEPDKQISTEISIGNDKVETESIHSESIDKCKKIATEIKNLKEKEISNNIEELKEPEVMPKKIEDLNNESSHKTEDLDHENEISKKPEDLISNSHEKISSPNDSTVDKEGSILSLKNTKSEGENNILIPEMPSTRQEECQLNTTANEEIFNKQADQLNLREVIPDNERIEIEESQDKDELITSTGEPEPKKEPMHSDHTDGKDSESEHNKVSSSNLPEDIGDNSNDSSDNSSMSDSISSDIEHNIANPTEIETNCDKMKEIETNSVELNEIETKGVELNEIEHDIANPNEIETNSEKPNEIETKSGKPNEIKSNSDKPNEIETNSGKPNAIETNCCKPNEIETNSDKTNEIETNSDKPNEIETNGDKPNEIETNSAELNEIETNSVELNDIEHDIATPNEIETNCDKPNEIETNSGKPNEIETIFDKPNEIETNCDKPNEIETNSGKPNEIETNCDIPNEIETNSSKINEIETNRIKVNGIETNSVNQLVVSASELANLYNNSPITCRSNCTQCVNVKEVIDLFESLYRKNATNAECSTYKPCNQESQIGDSRNNKYKNIFNRVNDKLKEFHASDRDDSFQQYREPSLNLPIESRHVLSETLQKCLHEMNESFGQDDREVSDREDEMCRFYDLNELIKDFNCLKLREEPSPTKSHVNALSTVKETNDNRTEVNTKDKLSDQTMERKGLVVQNPNKLGKGIKRNKNQTHAMNNTKVKSKAKANVTFNTMSTVPNDTVRSAVNRSLQTYSNLNNSFQQNSLALSTKEPVKKISTVDRNHCSSKRNNIEYQNKSNVGQKNGSMVELYRGCSNAYNREIADKQKRSLTIGSSVGCSSKSSTLELGTYTSYGSTVCRFTLDLARLFISLIILSCLLIVALILYQELGRRHCPSCSQLLTFFGDLLATKLEHFDGPPPI